MRHRHVRLSLVDTEKHVTAQKAMKFRDPISPLDAPLGQRLLQASFPHPVGELHLLETHVSWVILTGAWAYKVKKTVQFDFLDYSTVEQRRKCCQLELEINRVWAPEIYQDVVPLIEQGQHLRVGQAEASLASGERIADYAVRMRQFPQSALLLEQLRSGAITPAQMEPLAKQLVELHRRVDPVEGAVDLVQRSSIEPVRENIAFLLEQLSPEAPDRARIERLNTWTEQAILNLLPLMQARAQAGRVRNCHGDLHLNNLLYLGSEFVPFDGIEFSDALRQIDVISELAFLTMELSEHNYRQHAHRLVNCYLEESTDYQGLRLLPYYLVYRALVRVKVDLIRQQQTAGDRSAGRTGLSAAGRAYLAFAEQVVQPTRPQLWVTHGLSGSGKSTAALALVDHRGFLRLRSDVVRKQLAGLAPLDRPPAPQLPSLYAEKMTRRTYQQLYDQAQEVLAAGFSVVVDAAFLMRHQRDAFAVLAREQGVKFHILHCQSTSEELQRRIRTRTDDPSDATVAVLQQQIRTTQTLAEDELPCVVYPGDNHLAPALW